MYGELRQTPTDVNWDTRQAQTVLVREDADKLLCVFGRHHTSHRDIL
jgi:hypothetical protein